MSVERAVAALVEGLAGLRRLVSGLASDSTAERSAAARDVRRLLDERETHAALASAGGVEALVKLLQDGEEAEQAAASLAKLAENRETHGRLVQAGGVAELARLLREGKEAEQEAAADALSGLAENAEMHAVLLEGGAVAALLAHARALRARLRCEGDGGAEGVAPATAEAAPEAPQEAPAPDAGLAPESELVASASDAEPAEATATALAATISIPAPISSTSASVGGAPVAIDDSPAIEYLDDAMENAKDAEPNTAEAGVGNEDGSGNSESIPSQAETMENAEDAEPDTTETSIGHGHGSDNTESIPCQDEIVGNAEVAEPHTTEAGFEHLLDLLLRVGKDGKMEKALTIPPLVTLLQITQGRQRLAVVHALLNISGEEITTAAMVEVGAVPTLLEIARDGEVFIKELVCGLIGSISTCSQGQVAFVRSGGIPIYITLLSDKNRELQMNAARCLYILSRSKDAIETMGSELLITVLVALVRHGSSKYNMVETSLTHLATLLQAQIC